MSESKQFWGATFFTGLQSAVKLLVNFTLGKLAAVFIGPAGLGLLGQFQSLTLLVQNFSNGSIQNGIIKYLAGAETDEERADVVATGFTISVIMGLISGAVVFLFADYLNQQFLGIASYQLVFAVLAASAVFFSLNVFLSSIFNALKDYRSLSYFNMVLSLSNLVLFVPLIITFGLKGALIAVAAFQVPAFVAGYYLYRNKYKAYFKSLRLRRNKSIAARLATYSFMTLFAVTTFALSQLFIRMHLTDTDSAAAAGYWEGVNRISNFYIYFIALIITSQILPGYSAASDIPTLRRQIRFNFTRMMPLLAGILLLVYLFRTLLIRIVFSQEFVVMEQYLHWQLIGDFLKVGAWLLSNLLVARKYTLAVVLTDLSFNLIFTLVSVFLAYDVTTVTQCYAASSLLYLLLLVPVTFQLLKKEFAHETV